MVWCCSGVILAIFNLSLCKDLEEGEISLSAWCSISLLDVCNEWGNDEEEEEDEDDDAGLNCNEDDDGGGILVVLFICDDADVDDVGGVLMLCKNLESNSLRKKSGS